MDTMTPMERVVAALSHQEGDRVPYLLLTTMHPAKARGQTIKDYFSRAENVAEGQLAAQKKYGSDALYAFFYAPIEIEDCGGQVIYRADGPPNSGRPFLRSHEDIERFAFPAIGDAPRLSEVLRAIAMMKAAVGTTIPIFGVVMSPFSLPVMQMGFPAYLDLLHDAPELAGKLMATNEAFCISFANAQLKAGATGIVYFDPLSSPSVVHPALFFRHGKPTARRVIAAVNGPVASHFASGATVPILDDIIETGAVGIGVGATEDLVRIKGVCRNRATIIGNLDGIAMRRWDQSDVAHQVRRVINAAGRGGGLILADNHGEIPFGVPDEVLMAIGAAVRKWGRFPIAPPAAALV
jgi:uroporphyrinogen decarboxylase